MLLALHHLGVQASASLRTQVPCSSQHGWMIQQHMCEVAAAALMVKSCAFESVHDSACQTMCHFMDTC